MSFPKRHHFKKKHMKRPPRSQEARDPAQPESSGSESAYFRSLIDSRTKVTVVLKSGERFQGRVRYYDQDCFSLGLSATGPRLFLRKESVSYIAEDQ